MKEFISVLLAVIITLMFVSIVGAANTSEVKGFGDIADHWAKRDIEYMTNKGIVDGVSSAVFAPEEAITRAEFLALVIRTIGAEEAPYDAAYADVDESAWYARVIQTGKNLGIIDPAMTPNNEFKPDANITREEMTSLIIRAYELGKEEKVQGADISAFNDSEDVSDWARGYVERAYALSVIKGMSGKKLAPTETATRAQAVTIIRRLYKTTGKSLKILSIGNSFSYDSMKYLYGMLEECGYTDVVLGILYKGGCSLERHNNNIDGDIAEYKYYKNDSDYWGVTEGKCADDVVKDEDWDIVVLQQGSASSGLSETYEPYITNILAYIKENAPEDVKFAWNLTWAYQQDSTHASFPTYNSDQLFMYNSILAAFRENVLQHNEFEYIFPVGTTVQNIRTSYIGDTITRDGHHMDYNIGRYAAALTWLDVLTDVQIDEFDYIPKEVVIDESQREVVRESVVNALSNPGVITPSEFTKNPSANQQ